MTTHEGLQVAVTGPTGTFGFGLIPVLEADERIGQIVGVARRPFDPAEHGWSKMTYRQGDVRDRALLEAAFEGADVIVHLAFLVTGARGSGPAREINVDGTVNAFLAAAAVGAQRFVYASSVSAYGFHPDNPSPMTEDWPTRPALHMAYAKDKAELEARLERVAAEHPAVALYVLRPPVVVGPHVVGGKSALADRLLPTGRRLVGLARRAPLRAPMPAPDFELQVIHEDDVGTAFLQCVVGAGPPGAYNIAADEVITTADVVRELGLRPISIGGKALQRGARLLSRVPLPKFLPPMTSWAEAVSHPAIVDTTKANRDLHWQPKWSALDALRATLEPPA